MYLYRYHQKELWTEERVNAEIKKIKAEARSNFISDVIEMNGELYDQVANVPVPNSDAKYKDCSGGWGWFGDFETEEQITGRLEAWKERIKEDWGPPARAGRYMNKKFHEYNQQFRQPAVISDLDLMKLGYTQPHVANGYGVRPIEYQGGITRHVKTEEC